MTAERDEKPGDEREWVWLARIRRAQGRKGEVLAEILTDFPEKFAERKRVFLLAGAGAAAPAASREVELVSHWLHRAGRDGDVVLHFAGVDSISDAEALRGMIVAIPEAERAALGEDEYYAGDLMGCVLVDVAQRPARAVGVIEDVDRESGPVALLVVRGDASDEILVPFAKAYLRRVDLEGRRVEMELPEGLVDLAASS